MLESRAFATLLGAALTAFVAVALWVGNKWWERANARRARREKVLDLMRALHAEINAYVFQLSEDDLDRHREEIIGRIRRDGEDGERFVPLVPRESHDTIFRAILGELHLLPADAVAPVVLYYNQVIAIANLAEDLRSERFETISPERMSALYGHFIEMKKTARRMGEVARTRLESAIDAPVGAVNSREADPSDPESGA